jgi:L-ascorbate metabolism protein UlaG (beta-lactamase superfamily)
MKIKWYGHACFRIEGEGIAIVTDPYTPEDTVKSHSMIAWGTLPGNE